MTEPYDDPSIDDDDFVIRRVMSIHKRIKDGKLDFSNQAILLSSEDSGMSVSLKSSIIKAGLDPKRFYDDVPDCVGTIALRVGDIRSLDLIVGLDPEPDNPHHTQVWSATGAKNFSKGKRRSLKLMAGGYYALF